jgi:hypothetical protein
VRTRGVCEAYRGVGGLLKPAPFTRLARAYDAKDAKNTYQKAYQHLTLSLDTIRDLRRKEWP